MADRPSRGADMSWGPIVVGVDASTAAAGAAALAQRIARDAGTDCQLVHALRDAWAPFAAVGEAAQVQEMQLLQLAVARQQVGDVVKERDTPKLLEGLDLRFGPAAVVLQQVARERRAG